MTIQATDEQLIRWFRKGTADAFEQLYTRYKNAVYHYFYRQVQSPGIADELHQDVWLNIIKSSSVFTRRSSFKTWLYKIAHNRLVDHYRRISKQPFLLQKTVSEPEAVTEDYLSQHTGPDTMLQEQQISLALLDGIALLPKQKTLNRT